MTFNIFNPYPQLRYGISERKDGTMSVFPGHPDEARAAFMRNRRQFFEAKKVTGALCGVGLSHGALVGIVTPETIDRPLGEDGFLTNIPDCWLTITCADCFPVYMYDPVKNVAGLAHAGWRGIAKGIVGRMISRANGEFGIRAEDIRMGIGPGILDCHFEVGANVADIFKEYGSHISSHQERYFIDLPGIIGEQAVSAGVNRVESANVCTYCEKEKYFSHRREQTVPPSVMVAYIGITDYNKA